MESARTEAGHDDPEAGLPDRGRRPRQVSRRARPRPWRDGRRVRRDPRGASPASRAEGALSRRREAPGVDVAVHQRSARRGAHQGRARRHRHRRRSARERPPVHLARVPRGEGPLEGERGASWPRCWTSWTTCYKRSRRSRRRTPPASYTAISSRRTSSRRQVRTAARSSRCSTSASSSSRARARSSPIRGGARLSRVHGARAGRVELEERRRARRHLVSRHHPLPLSHGRRAVPRRQPGRGLRRRPRRRRCRCARRGPTSRGARGGDHEVPGEGAHGPVGDRRGLAAALSRAPYGSPEGQRVAERVARIVSSSSLGTVAPLASGLQRPSPRSRCRRPARASRATRSRRRWSPRSRDRGGDPSPRGHPLRGGRRDHRRDRRRRRRQEGAIRSGGGARGRVRAQATAPPAGAPVPWFERTPKGASDKYALGLKALREGFRSEAVAAFEAATQEDVWLAPAYLRRSILQLTRRPDEVRVDFAHAVEQESPGHPRRPAPRCVSPRAPRTPRRTTRRGRTRSPA